MKNEKQEKKKPNSPQSSALKLNMWKGESNTQLTFSEGEPQIRTGRVAKVGLMVALQRPENV